MDTADGEPCAFCDAIGSGIWVIKTHAVLHLKSLHVRDVAASESGNLPKHTVAAGAASAQRACFLMHVVRDHCTCCEMCLSAGSVAPAGCLVREVHLRRRDPVLVQRCCLLHAPYMATGCSHQIALIWIAVFVRKRCCNSLVHSAYRMPDVPNHCKQHGRLARSLTLPFRESCGSACLTAPRLLSVCPSDDSNHPA